MLYLPDVIDTTVVDFLRMLYRIANFDVDGLQLAKIDNLLRESAGARTTTDILSLIAFIVSVLLGVIIAITVAKKRALKNPATESSMQPEAESVEVAPARLRNAWDGIVQHLDSTHENDWRLAVMEADKFVDAALLQAGFPGGSFGDRLTNIAPGMLLSLDGLWWAHKIRNRIAHEVGYFLRYTEAKAALSYYEAALAELHLI